MSTQALEQRLFYSRHLLRTFLNRAFAANPRINTALACAIRTAKLGNERPTSAKNFVVREQTTCCACLVRRLSDRSNSDSKGTRTRESVGMQQKTAKFQTSQADTSLTSHKCTLPLNYLP